jgi:hypothetical protein
MFNSHYFAFKQFRLIFIVKFPFGTSDTFDTFGTFPPLVITQIIQVNFSCID